MDEREKRWHQNRCGKVTSSSLAKLLTKGTKGKLWGDTSINYLYEKLYELENNKPIRNESNANFRWGHEQEPLAIEWLRANTMYDIKHCSEDFDEIRKIISEQNMIDLPDERIQKNVRDSLEEARRFKQKLNKNKVASFEEQMMALATYTGWSLDEIYNMTYRKFVLAIRRANQIIMSNIYLTASMSGFVSFKDKSVLKSWISDINEEDKYSDVKMSPEKLQSKANFEEAKKK